MTDRRAALRSLGAVIASSLLAGCSSDSPNETAESATSTPTSTPTDERQTDTDGTETPVEETPPEETPTPESDWELEPVEEPAHETTEGGSIRIDADVPHLSDESRVVVEEIDVTTSPPIVRHDWINPTVWWMWDTGELIRDRRTEFILSIETDDDQTPTLTATAEDGDTECRLSLRELADEGPYEITSIEGDEEWCPIGAGWTVVEVGDDSVIVEAASSVEYYDRERWSHGDIVVIGGTVYEVYVPDGNTVQLVEAE